MIMNGLPNFSYYNLLRLENVMVRDNLVVNLTHIWILSIFSTQIRNGNGIQILKTVKYSEILCISTMLLQQLF
jgi:hypothetical protein